MNFFIRLGSFFYTLLRDPFVWWIATFLIGVTLLSRSLATDVLSGSPILLKICMSIGSWIPWIPKIAVTYSKFPEVAFFILTLLWVTLPLQIGVMIWLWPSSALIRSEVIPYARKYPIRFPGGVLLVLVLMTISTIWQLDATDVAKLSGWRPSSFMSEMPNSQAWFGFGAAVHFFAISFLAFIFFKSVNLIVGNKLHTRS